jgi:hypothetical protein
MSKKKLELIEARELSTSRDGADYMYRFSLIDISFVGQPEEKSSTSYHRIKVGISGTMIAAWMAKQVNIDIQKICCEYGKRELIQKTKDGRVQDYQELIINSLNYPDECPFQSNRIKSEIGSVFEFEVAERTGKDVSLLEIASSIIESRNSINVILKERCNKVLFLFSEERDLLQLLRPANTIEEFSYRISALKTFATNLNDSLLRELTGVSDNNIHSISLLQKYLQQFDNYNESIINTFRNINRLRQKYPIHGDNVSGVQEAHRYFSIDYPINNSTEAWKSILIFYRDAVQRILEIVKQ